MFPMFGGGMMAGRNQTVEGLKELKSPEEGGTRKDHEEMLEKLHQVVSVNWPSGMDVSHLLDEDEEEIKLEMPELDTSGSEAEKRDWGNQVDEIGMRKRLRVSNMKALYSVVYGNLSSVLKSRVNGIEDYDEADKKKDVVWLLTAIEDIMPGFDKAKHRTRAKYIQLNNIMKMIQGDGVTTKEFLKKLKREIKVLEKYGGSFMWGSEEEQELEEALDEKKKEYSRINKKSMPKEKEKDAKGMIKRKIKDEILSIVLVEKANRKRFGNLQIKLHNAYLAGHDDYPKNTGDAINMMDNYMEEWVDGRPPRANSPSPQARGRNAAASFLQASEEEDTVVCKFLQGTNGSFHPRVACHLCRFKGHYKSACPWRKDENGARITSAEAGTSREQATEQEVRRAWREAIVLNQTHASYLNPNWILLDSESSDHIFCNEDLVTGIHKTTDGSELSMYSNGGGRLNTRKKAFFGTIPVWFEKDSLANILSMALVSDDFRLTMDTWVENAIILHVSERHSLSFKRVSEDLYVCDASNVDLSKLRKSFNFLSTVESNKSYFKARDVRKADEAIVLNRRTNHMAKDKFLRVVKNYLIRNCPITVGDVRRSNIIYGPPLPPIKGRTKYKESPRVREKEIIQLPKEVYEDLKHVTLCGDFFYVNGVTVFHMISRRIDYRTVSFPLSRSRQSIVNEFDLVRQKYHRRGFRITDLHADNEFKKVENDILPVRLERCGVDDHVPEVERSVQTMKNECRSVCHAMPYRCFPRIMVREMVKQANEFLNAFGNGEMANGLTPRNIIDNLPHVNYNDLKYEFGEYVQLHLHETITNTMKTRAVGAIVMGPRNVTGRYNFMSLETGSEINGRVISQHPITEPVKLRVEALGAEQEQPFRASKMLTFEWRPGHPLGDDDVQVVAPPTAMVTPEPIDLPDPGPNPFAPADVHAAAGANGQNGHQQGQGQQDQPQATGQQQQIVVVTEENGNKSNDDAAGDDGDNDGDNAATQEEGETQNQQSDAETEIGTAGGVNEGTNKGASETNEGANGEDEGAVDGRTEEQQGEVDDETIERRNRERERRGGHLVVDTSDDAGRGMRVKKKRKMMSLMHCRRDKKKKGQSSKGRKGSTRPTRKSWAKHRVHDGRPPKQRAFLFLQKKFVDLNAEERKEFLVAALNEMQYMGRTHLMERYTCGWTFAQMLVKKGIDLYGKEAERKLMAEFAQLLEYEVFHGRKVEELTEEQKKGAANMINLIEEKINRGHTRENPVIKARSVFNGRVQRGLYSKEELASPTVSLDGFFLSSIADAIEERFIAVTDIKGAYLHAHMKDLVIMKISGPEVGIFCELNPKLKEFVVDEKGKQVLYVQLDKALYGCVQSALLWYETYLGTLKEIGFEINPYDPCVANAIIDGHQCTICWYVDDNKISHKEEKVVLDVIGKIEEKYGKMSSTQGSEHNFLGMELKFQKGKLTVSMKKHILKAFEIFMEEVTRNASTPAKSYLFEVREGTKELDEAKADNFHSVVALLLYISRRCRLDIQTAVGFLTTRVSSPDEDDWIQLRRVMQYLQGTIDLTLTIGGESMKKMKSWVDVSYGVHSDSKSHTGGCASFGWGAVLTKCQKQKLNVKSSTEGEVVGVSDYLPNMIWARMFLGAQGYELEENILYQDNQSAIKLEKNGRVSSGQKTKHMDNRFFWIKDRLKSEKIEIVYCPTEAMLADFFTKPLQGSLFKKFREVVLGYVHIDVLIREAECSTKQERVRNEEKEKVTGSSVRTTSASDKTVTWSEVVQTRGNDPIFGKGKASSLDELIPLKQSHW